MPHSIYPEQYEQQLEQKMEKVRQQFWAFFRGEIETFDSPRQGFRMRAEFKVWQEAGVAHYAMYRKNEYKQPFMIEDFAMGSDRINELMPLLMSEINQSELLRKRLFQAEFLTTLDGEALITLIYHKPLDETWEQEARALKDKLQVHIIGRSRKQKMVLDQDFVTETLTVNERQFKYQQVEASFTQPNARVCEKMLSWASNACHNATGDLLELYCGNGNFTLPLSQYFNKVLATEISKVSVHSAQYNMRLNDIENITMARLSSEEFCEAIDKVREFRRLKDIDLDSFDIQTIFVDPPRAGMDPLTTELAKRYNTIIYISCNPDTLARDLSSICETHNVEKMAVFDQFPYTEHLECGVILSKK